MIDKPGPGKGCLFEKKTIQQNKNKILWTIEDKLKHKSNMHCYECKCFLSKSLPERLATAQAEKDWLRTAP